MAEPIDEQIDDFIISVMQQHYGDLLKVSRTRGILQTLPKLREYISENPYIREGYEEAIQGERDGQGLEHNAVLNSLIAAQMLSFVEADSKNTTMFASEVKKLITEGQVTRNGSTVETTGSDSSEEMVQQILNHPLTVEVDKITTEDANRVREILTNKKDGFERFVIWKFQIQMGFEFQKQDFHSIMFDACQKIVNGELDRLVVTIPPRHSKTQTISIDLPAYSFVLNPTSHNIITSYADDVVNESSGYIRATLNDPLVQKIFPAVKIDPSKRSLERWGTTKAGVMNAVPTGGKLTGKGAGNLGGDYAGVFCVDDAIKPKDAYSAATRTEINDRFNNTFMSRLANDGTYQKNGETIECGRTPMVVIMQRVHDDDLVGYILRGNSSDSYVWLNIPAIITPECGSREWYGKLIKRHAYTHAIPYLYTLERSEPETALWASRKSLKSLKAMERADPYTFNSQYMGNPSAKGLGIIKDEWWRTYTTLDKSIFIKTFMTSDTASTKQDHSDYSVIALWGITRSQELYLIDIVLGKWETPELKQVIADFWKLHTKLDLRYPTMLPTALYQEDKSSGQYLNQQFMRDGSVRVLPIPRDKSANDKIARFLNTAPYFAQLRLVFPEEHEHIDHVKREVLGFTGLGSGTGNDDVCDVVSDACVVAFSVPTANYSAWV